MIRIKNSDAESFWTTDQRKRFVAHIMTELRKATNTENLKLLIQIVPEDWFLREESLKKLQGNIQGGWSIWIRETFGGIPFDYNHYMETAIHEVAHAITSQKIRTHAHSNRTFKRNLDLLRAKATEYGVWPKQRVPEDLRDLFK